jgi:hypothetical protein
MKIILDEKTNKLRIQTSEAEYQKLKIDADQRGVSVEELLQGDLDRIAGKMLPKRC